MRSSAFSGTCLDSHSTLGTPNDETWPGVKSLPDYKTSFPQWSGVPLKKAVPALDDNGLDLLRQMLVYDTASRISGMSLD